METIDTRDVFGKDVMPEPEVKRASFGARLGAYAIDMSLIISVLLMPYLLMNTPFSLLWFGLIFVLVYLLKDSIKGQSLGKFIFGLGVRMADKPEELPSFGRRMLRNLTLSRLTKTRVYRLKKRKIWLVALALVLAMALPILIMVLAPDRTPLTAEEFTSKMEAMDFVVEDALHLLTPEMAGPALGEMESYLVVMESGLFLEFIVYTTEAGARRAYAMAVANIQQLRAGGGYATTQMGFANFDRFTQTAAGTHAIVSRIDNTMILAYVAAEHRNDLNRLLRTLGY